VIFLIAVAGYVAALVAIFRFADSESRYTRAHFSWYAIPYLTPWLFGMTNDVLRLNGVDFITNNTVGEFFNITFTDFFIVYCALFAYPLFRQIMGRLRDTNLGRTWAYLALLPIVNVLILLVLMARPTVANEVSPV